MHMGERVRRAIGGGFEFAGKYLAAPALALGSASAAKAGDMRTAYELACAAAVLPPGSAWIGAKIRDRARLDRALCTALRGLVRNLFELPPSSDPHTPN